MFIGYYELEGKEHFDIYFYSNWGEKGYILWRDDTFSPLCKNIKTLDFRIKGKNYQERKNNLIELAKEWQLDFSYLSWSYSELAEIVNYFYNNGKRYGLLKEFRENGIC